MPVEQTPLETHLTGGGRATAGDLAGRAVLVVPLEGRVWELHDKPWDVPDEDGCEDSYWPHDEQLNTEWSKWGIEWVPPGELDEFVRTHWPEFDAQLITAKRLPPRAEGSAAWQRHRTRSWWARVGTTTVNLGRVLFFALMGAMVILGGYLAVASIVDADEPRYWGTFTEESCTERTRHGCRSVGTWVSDDGSIRLEGVYLDGVVADGGTVAAQYQPTGLDNDADANIVHTAFGASIEPFAGVALIAFAGGVAFVYWRKWRGTWTLTRSAKSSHR